MPVKNATAAPARPASTTPASTAAKPSTRVAAEPAKPAAKGFVLPKGSPEEIKAAIANQQRSDFQACRNPGSQQSYLNDLVGLATIHNQPEDLKAALDAGGNPNCGVMTLLHKEMPIVIASNWAQGGVTSADPRLAALVQSPETNLNEQGRQGTALHRSAVAGQTAHVKLLLEQKHRFDINARNEDGQTALGIAKQSLARVESEIPRYSPTGESGAPSSFLVDAQAARARLQQVVTMLTEAGATE